MLPVQIIAQKRDGCELSENLIADFVDGYTNERIPDYQMAAFAMAIYLQGMTSSETAALTQAMLDSGDRLCWPDDGILRVDKHSTGGVGDKTSLPLAPLLAACGLQVPMLSGRGLGPTGGTLDKLEAIAGFRTDLTLQEIRQQVKNVGCVITGASADLAPADRRLYALRDVTATVPSIPLITASIMSKKLAESPDALVLDVKFGSGAFMKTLDQARLLAESLVATGQRMGVRTSALLTSMNQPLGRMCGNAVEVEESLDILRGQGPVDARRLTLELAAETLLLACVSPGRDQAIQMATERLDSGTAMEFFEAMVAAQGGDLSAPRPIAPSTEVTADQTGVIAAIDVESLGYAVVQMGGGRRQLTDTIDHSVGIEMLVQIGESVERGQPLMRVFCDDPQPDALRQSVGIADAAPDESLIVEHVRGDHL